MNYYELLEVSTGASVEVIKNAYKTLAKKYHPDAYEGDKAFAEEKMKNLNEAISVLENEEKRRDYNMAHGIYNDPENYGYEGENGININRDENGEPVFFSYSSEFDDDEVKRSAGLLDRLDDILNNRRARKNKKKAADGADEGLDLNDLVETLSSDRLDDFNDTGVPDISQMPYYEPDEDQDGDQDFRTVRFAKKSGKSKAPRWYSITLTGLLAGILLLLIMNAASVDWGNMRNIIGRIGGAQEPEPPYEYAPEPDEPEPYEPEPEPEPYIPAIDEGGPEELPPPANNPPPPATNPPPPPLPTDPQPDPEPDPLPEPDPEPDPEPEPDEYELEPDEYEPGADYGPDYAGEPEPEPDEDYGPEPEDEYEPEPEDEHDDEYEDEPQGDEY